MNIKKRVDKINHRVQRRDFLKSIEKVEEMGQK